MKKINILIWIIFSVLTTSAQDTTSKKNRTYYPHFVNMQYAGNMGFMSIGAGYRFDKRRMGLGLQFGYLPESIGGTRLWTSTIKYFWTPIQKHSNEWDIEPLMIGINIIKTHGDGIEQEWPDYYPNGYYPWIPAMNYAFFIGSALHFNLPREKKYLNRVGVFYEIAITSRLISVWYENPKTVRFLDIWNFSTGLQFSLR